MLLFSASNSRHDRSRDLAWNLARLIDMRAHARLSPVGWLVPSLKVSTFNTLNTRVTEGSKTLIGLTPGEGMSTENAHFRNELPLSYLQGERSRSPLTDSLNPLTTENYTILFVNGNISITKWAHKNIWLKVLVPAGLNNPSTNSFQRYLNITSFPLICRMTCGHQFGNRLNKTC